MNTFNHKKIILEFEAIIKELRQAREKKGLNLQEVARILDIQEKYLKSLEDGNFKELPEGVYGYNFLRKYANFLGVDDEALVQIFKKEIAELKKIQYKRLFVQKVSRVHNFLFLPKIVKGVIIFFVILACFLYLAFSLKNIVSPPPLIVRNPSKDIIINDYSFVVKGTTEPGTQVYINGDSVLLNSDGSFSRKINLKEGFNVINIEAQKKYGKKKVVKRRILVKP